MITFEKLEELAKKLQMTSLENVMREYLQHIFLAELYGLAGSEKLLFKGGMALRVIYKSPRFSEDLDFSLFSTASGAQNFIEDRFQDILVKITQLGIGVELGPKLGPTLGGYFGEAFFTLYGRRINLSINISQRQKSPLEGELEAIVNDYIPTYNLLHLPKKFVVEEKISAFFERKKPRDFYDLYFMLRGGLIGTEEKKRLAQAKGVVEKTEADFAGELKTFLPKSHHPIIGQLKERLLEELTRQLAAGLGS